MSLIEYWSTALKHVVIVAYLELLRDANISMVILNGGTKVNRLPKLLCMLRTKATLIIRIMCLWRLAPTNYRKHLIPKSRWQSQCIVG